MSHQLKLCVAVPMFNEEGGAENCVIEINKVLKNLKNVHSKLLVVNDGSSDNTHEVLTELEKKS